MTGSIYRGTASVYAAPFDTDKGNVTQREARLLSWEDDSKCLLPVDPDWMQRGNCYGTNMTDLFFPVRGSRATAVGNTKAQRICDGCPVQKTCLEYAMANNIRHGIWGGVGERERARIRQARRASEEARKANEQCALLPQTS